jgi:hypothetical protein
MHLVSESAVEETLRTAVDQARTRYKKAFRDFESAIADSPNSSPQPDGVQRLRAAMSERSFAQQELDKALRRINDYLLRGTVPEDLRERVQAAGV